MRAGPFEFLRSPFRASSFVVYSPYAARDFLRAPPVNFFEVGKGHKTNGIRLEGRIPFVLPILVQAVAMLFFEFSSDEQLP